MDGVMRRDVAYVSRRATLREAARLMRDRGVGFLPVVGGDLRVCGAITARDLVVRGLAEARSPDVAVEDVMSRELVAVRPDDTVGEAARKMRTWRRSRVMVLDEQGLCCGVVSRSDLARDAPRTDAAFRRPRRRA